ncbi:Multimodular transpeptidase-transglycosylase [gamma proteobacterium IMCC2047]|nr:Multimodular transpeptidase-transglycosylase [gamma proteobacterium IMCC2047]
MRQLSAQRIIEPRAAYIMNTILRDVVQRGTARRAKALGRSDLAGKTGTTNDQKDAWFSGFQRHVVATAWVGFDQPRTMGRREVGGFAAMPIWIDFMRDALKGIPESPLEQPPGLVTVRIDPATGLRAGPGSSDAIFEIFRTENTPKEAVNHNNLPPVFGESEETLPEQLF